ncbi:MAG TPA: RNase adapter RapZ [Candidatus Acidoferrales bacterium]|nr:RNase adapter RapZ [Candidatus Acidoferrales bacterium]
MAPHRSEHSRQLVILTGLSGSGKGSVLRTFEDLGFYCIDNLPVSFIPSFAEMYMDGGGEFERAVLLVDAREGEQLKRLPEIFKRLRRAYPATLVFMEASNQALARRFSETRRPHPGGVGLSIAEGIRLERKRMAQIRALADVIIDTTKFTVHDLRQFVVRKFQEAGQKSLLISVISFGFRFGPPADADLVFDVRFLPNPHFVPKLRPFSGKNPRVARYIRSFKQTGEFLRRIEGLLAYLIPHYIREGKSYLTIAFGCTGGRHRSVMLAEAVGEALAKRGYTVKIEHRDLDRSAS